MVSLPGRCDGHPAGTVGARPSGRLRLQHWEAEAPNAIMGWTVFQPRREQWIRQRYESLRSSPQLENGARFRDGKVAHEHIYWDQASVLKQIGLLTDPGLPVFGGETARKVAAPLGCTRSSQ
jgi:hypothetical protein